MNSRVLCLFVVFAFGYVNATPDDDYMLEAEGECNKEQGVLACGKYNLLKYLDSVSSNAAIESNATYPVQLVKIAHPDEEGTFFPESRSMSTQGEFGKLLKFMQNRADKFLRTQGIAFPLPRGFRIVDENEDFSDDNESRGRVGPKKKGLIPLLTLFGVFKVKVMLGLVLLGILFIKKVILLGALVLPSILHNIKATCKHIVPHHISHGGHGEEYHDEYYGA